MKVCFDLNTDTTSSLKVAYNPQFQLNNKLESKYSVLLENTTAYCYKKKT